jgi:hypothetical protein
MNVSMNTSIQGQGRPPPPNSEDMATRMASAVSNGDIDIEQLQENLTERLGVEDTSSIIAEDGSVDVAELTSLLEANKPGGAEGGGRPPPPPGGGGPGGPGGGAGITELLTDILGEEGLEEVTEEDGSYDIDELVIALREQLESTDQSTSGNLLDLVA